MTVIRKRPCLKASRRVHRGVLSRGGGSFRANSIKEWESGRLDRSCSELREWPNRRGIGSCKQDRPNDDGSERKQTQVSEHTGGHRLVENDRSRHDR